MKNCFMTTFFLVMIIFLVENTYEINLKKALVATETAGFGNCIGSTFVDTLPNVTSCSKLRVYQVNFRGGFYIDQIQFVLKDKNGNIYQGPVHGGNGGSPGQWTVPDGENIVKAVVNHGDSLDSVTFTTDKGTTFHIGGNGGSPETVNFTGTLFGLKGCADQYLRNLGFVTYQ